MQGGTVTGQYLAIQNSARHCTIPAMQHKHRSLILIPAWLAVLSPRHSGLIWNFSPCLDTHTRRQVEDHTSPSSTSHCVPRDLPPDLPGPHAFRHRGNDKFCELVQQDHHDDKDRRHHPSATLLLRRRQETNRRALLANATSHAHCRQGRNQPSSFHRLRLLVVQLLDLVLLLDLVGVDAHVRNVVASTGFVMRSAKFIAELTFRISTNFSWQSCWIHSIFTWICLTRPTPCRVAIAFAAVLSVKITTGSMIPKSSWINDCT